MNSLWFDLAFRRRVREQIKALQPWYQQQMLLPGLWTRPWTQATIGELIHAERGGPKWRRFILPMIKPYLKGATILEIGCNAGQMLVCGIGAGAGMGIGIESDPRYFSQAMLVRQAFGLQSRLRVFRSLDDAEGYWHRLYGGWDLGMMCAVLRHIPEPERVDMLERMGKLCRRILINGNGLPDAPDGDSVESILGYVRQTNLRVEDLRSEPHVRGLRILLRVP